MDWSEKEEPGARRGSLRSPRRQDPGISAPTQADGPSIGSIDGAGRADVALKSGNSPNSTAMREASAAAIATSSSQASSRCTPVSNRGTNVEALTKISELAQKPVCSQTRSRYRQLSGARRTRPTAPAVSPALTTATTPETSNSC